MTEQERFDELLYGYVTTRDEYLSEGGYDQEKRETLTNLHEAMREMAVGKSSSPQD